MSLRELDKLFGSFKFSSCSCTSSPTEKFGDARKLFQFSTTNFVRVKVKSKLKICGDDKKSGEKSRNSDKFYSYTFRLSNSQKYATSSRRKSEKMQKVPRSLLTDFFAVCSLQFRAESKVLKRLILKFQISTFCVGEVAHFCKFDFEFFEFAAQKISRLFTHFPFSTSSRKMFRKSSYSRAFSVCKFSISCWRESWKVSTLLRRKLRKVSILLSDFRLRHEERLSFHFQLSKFLHRKVTFTSSQKSLRKSNRFQFQKFCKFRFTGFNFSTSRRKKVEKVREEVVRSFLHFHFVEKVE